MAQNAQPSGQNSPDLLALLQQILANGNTQNAPAKLSPEVAAQNTAPAQPSFIDQLSQMMQKNATASAPQAKRSTELNITGAPSGQSAGKNIIQGISKILAMFA